MTHNKQLRLLLGVALSLCFSFLLILPSVGEEIPDETRYGRSALAQMENGEALVNTYDHVREGIKNKLVPIPLDYENHPITVTELKTVMSAFYQDNCNYFWYTGVYSCQYQYVTNYAVTVTCSYNQSLYEQRNAFDSALHSFYESIGITSDMSDFEKTLLIHDALIEHITYDSNAAGKGVLSNSHLAYGAIINGSAVCEGYTRAYHLLLAMCGIQSTMITGTAGNNNELHAWNLVRVNGKYYLTDVTWDDQGSSGTFYQYLNRSAAFVNTNHKPSNTLYPMPSCSDDDMGYYQIYGGMIPASGNKDALVSLFKKSDSVRIYVTGDNYSSFWNNFLDIFNDVAKEAGYVMDDWNVKIYAQYRNVGREYILTITGPRYTYFNLNIKNGTAKVSGSLVSSVAAGKTVSITANKADKGMYFVSWRVLSGNVSFKDKNATTTTFTMPNSDVSLEAVYASIPKLYFNDSASFDIPEGYTGTSISSFSVTGSVSGGKSPYTYSISGPTWLKISADGQISGTRPSTTSAKTAATITVQDSFNQTASISIQIGSIKKEQYSVTVSGGKATLNGITESAFEPGVTVKLQLDAIPQGYEFSHWSIQTSSGSARLSNASAKSPTFVMPHEKVEITAHFSKIPTLVFTFSASFDLPTGETNSTITSFSVSKNVSGGKGTYTFEKQSGPSWISVSSSGIISGKRPNVGQNATTAVIGVKDESGQTASITIQVGAVQVPETTTQQTENPITTTPVIEPITTIPETTEPITEPITTEAITTEVVTEPMSEEITTEPETTAFQTEPETTLPMTTIPETTEPMTIEEETSNDLKTTNEEIVTTTPFTTQPKETTEVEITTMEDDPESTPLITFGPTAKKAAVLLAASVGGIVLLTSIIRVFTKKRR